jgi:tetratricopeptide (TPR) repeat protein
MVNAEAQRHKYAEKLEGKKVISARRLVVVIAVVALLLFGAWFYAKAIAELSLARRARQNDDCAAAEQHLADCWRLPGLRSSIHVEEALLGVQQGDLVDEVAWQRRAERDAGNRLLIFEALAKGSLATFRVNEARTYAEAMLQLQPASARALWLRGRAFAKLQQEEKGLEDLREAVRLEPTAGEIRLSLADLLHNEGFVHEAEAHYQPLLSQGANYARVRVALAQCWTEDAHLDDAAQLLDRLLARFPDNIAGMVERAKLALRRRDPKGGEQWASRAVAWKSDDADAIFVLQSCLEAQERRDDDLYARRERNEQTQARLRAKLQTNPRDPVLLTDVGHWMTKTGDPHEAAGWFFLALREDSKCTEAHVALANYFAAMRQPQRAMVHRRIAGRSPLEGETLVEPTLLGSAPGSNSRVSFSTKSPLPATAASPNEVHRLCAACHVYPPPDSMPRAAWRKEVKLGFDFLRDSKLSGDYPPLENVVRFYEEQAPERLPRVELPAPESKPPVRFERAGAGWLANVPPFPGVANAELASLFGGEQRELLACDTRIDRVMLLRPYESSPAWQPLAQVPVPDRATVADLDGDGRRDILVAALGQFFPTDDKLGSVVWLRAVDDGRFELVTILEGVGRVADIQAADFNGDGRLDLVVAIFGWRKTGEILYLENRTTDWARPEFVPRQMDERHGAIHVPVVDLNADGRPDVVALISQEHETVVAYLNQGDGTFRKEQLFAAPHPSYGCSGIQVIDLDGDGDHDVLLTNGDVLDRPYLLKPYHGVAWLENEGGFPFTHHRLISLYGASRAVAADFDGDNDLDIVAVSFLPRLEFPDREALRLPSVVLLEQSSRGSFEPHVLESGSCDHFTCAAGDWNGDGRPDLAIGNFSWKRSEQIKDAAVLWKNLGPEKRSQ